jgi:nitroimidazol reductase NimA-like FMN-containing flavoprotein (pyridoxamine 5'-phosphate oxidase superfamily)
MTSPSPHPGGNFEELSTHECMSLLEAKHVGRVAICTSIGPQVFPVNYTMHKDKILFRTAPYTQLGRQTEHARVAFQLDDVDEFYQSGWSVLVVGHAHRIDDPDELNLHVDDRPEPWASGSRTLYIEIEPDAVTGRRVLPN